MNDVVLDSGSADPKSAIADLGTSGTISGKPEIGGASRNDFSQDDQRYMRLALALGRRGLGRTWPNPSVGAVIVKDGVIVGRGWTQAGGRPHAETEALRRARRAANGATMYVTLEPCSHDGKTPPCADAIIKAGIKRVVSALEDPNPEVAGQGHARLREKGIKVDVGLFSAEAKRVHAGHIDKITKGRPNVLLKVAVSADNKVGLAGRKRAFITGDETQVRVHMMRARSDAVLTGIGTVLADNPQLTCRLPGMVDQSPVRVVLDAQLRTPLSLGVVATVREWPTWIFCSTKASPIAEEILTLKGVKVFRVEEQDGKLDIDQVLKRLAEEGITRVMVEAGPRINASFISAGVVDKVALLRGPKPIGDTGLDPVEDMDIAVLTEGMKPRGTEQLGPDAMEWYERA